MKTFQMIIVLLTVGMTVAQNPTLKISEEVNLKNKYTQELRELYAQSKFLENTTPEEINANRLAIRNAWMKVDPSRGNLYRPVDNGGHTEDYITSVIDYRNTTPPPQTIKNRWAQDIQVHNLRIDGGIDIVEFNDGEQLYASSYRALPTPTLDLYVSNDLGETWSPWQLVTFSEQVVKLKMLTLFAATGDRYLLVYYLSQGNFFNVMRWNLTTGAPLETDVITGDVVDFALDRNYSNNTVLQRVFAVYQKSNNLIYAARTNAGTYGFDWVDETFINGDRRELSLCYGRAGSIYLASVTLTNRSLVTRVNTDYNDPNAWEASSFIEDGAVRESVKPTIRAERLALNQENVIVVTSSRGAGNNGKYNIRRYIKKNGAGFGTGITNASPNGISYLYFDSFINYYNDDSNVYIGFLRQSIDGSENNRVLLRPYDGDILQESEYASYETLDVFDNYKPLAITSIKLGMGEEPMMVFAGTSANGTHAEGLYFDKKSSVLNTVDFESAYISVCPNPAQNKVEVQFSREAMPKSLAIYDTTGKLLNKQFFMEGTDTAIVDVSFFNNGVYFLSFQTNRGTITKRIIKN